MARRYCCSIWPETSTAMQDVNVLVVFHAVFEQLALAAAVGAVQGRANIRLRRLPDADGEATIESERLAREYVAPRETDAAWADAIILSMQPGTEPYFDSLAALGKQVVALTHDPGADGVTSARLLGRRVAEAARSRKAAELR